MNTQVGNNTPDDNRDRTIPRPLTADQKSAMAERRMRRTRRNADGRTQREQAALERRARFSYDHDCDM